MAQTLLPRRLLIPYPDLDVEQATESYVPLDLSKQYGLSIVVGVTPAGIGRILQLDAAGRLVFSGAAGQAGVVQVGDSGVPSRLVDIESGVIDNDAGGNNMRVGARNVLFNNSFWNRARDASFANLNLQSGLGVGLATSPGNWVVSSVPAAGSQASASKAAGAVGVHHVATGVVLTYSATTALAGITSVVWNLRDGGTGAGTILFSVDWTLPATTINPFGLVIALSNIVGTGNTGMTWETSAAIGNLLVSANLFGFDVS